MNRPSWKCLLIGAVVAVALSSAIPQADAQWWGAYQPVAWGCGYAPCYSRLRHGELLVPAAMIVAGGIWVGGRGRSEGCSLAAISGTLGRLRNRLVRVVRRLLHRAPMAARRLPRTHTPAKKPVTEPTMPTGSTTPARCPGGTCSRSACPAGGTCSRSAAPWNAMPVCNRCKRCLRPAAHRRKKAALTVWVPYGAKVTVNGLETRSTGSRRQFVSYGLKPGFSYKYVVRAEVVRNGQMQEDTRTVTLTAGQITAVAFGFNTTSPRGGGSLP